MAGPRRSNAQGGQVVSPTSEGSRRCRWQLHRSDDPSRCLTLAAGMVDLSSLVGNVDPTDLDLNGSWAEPGRLGVVAAAWIATVQADLDPLLAASARKAVATFETTRSQAGTAAVWRPVVVHGDFVPINVIVRPDGGLALVDLAWWASSSGTTIPTPGPSAGRDRRLVGRARRSGTVERRERAETQATYAIVCGPWGRTQSVAPGSAARRPTIVSVTSSTGWRCAARTASSLRPVVLSRTSWATWIAPGSGSATGRRSWSARRSSLEQVGRRVAGGEERAVVAVVGKSVAALGAHR